MPSTHASALNRWRAVGAAGARKRLSPPPKLSLSEWADRYRHLSRENSAEPGPWRTDRVPYLREIMDAVSNPDIAEMILMKCSRVGFTEGVIGNGVGYYIDQDPAPILVVQPSEQDAEDWSKKKLAPMLRDTPRLEGRVAEPRGRDSDSTILSKSFPGGSLKITGATSPKGLRRTDARVAFLDEVDGYPASAGPEGDPVSLARRRLTTFWNRKLVLGSTPTIKGLSRIEKAFDDSDQRFYHVPCPHCGHFQVLRWGHPTAAYGIKWEEGKPETAAYLCAGCGALIDERDKAAMVAGGRWIPREPTRALPGWHLNALISPFDGARWPVLVRDFLAAKDDPEQLKVFVNTVLGESWEDRGRDVDPTSLQGRAEHYDAEVPDGVGILTAGVDVQADRLELELVGWGDREESWRVAHHRVEGDTERQETWERLEALLTRPYLTARGFALRIQCCMVDSGFRTRTVYGFVRSRQLRNVFASKGVEERSRAPLTRAKKANSDGVKLFTIGTTAMKDALFGRLRIQRPGPRYMHFRAMMEDGGFDGEFFAQLGAEELVLERRGGRRVRRYVQKRDRNEAIDLEVLNLAALHALGAGVREQLGDLARRVQTAAPRPGASASPATPAPASRPARRVRSRGLL